MLFVYWLFGWKQTILAQTAKREAVSGPLYEDFVFWHFDQLLLAKAVQEHSSANHGTFTNPKSGLPLFSICA